MNISRLTDSVTSCLQFNSFPKFSEIFGMASMSSILDSDKTP